MLIVGFTRDEPVKYTFMGVISLASRNPVQLDEKNSLPFAGIESMRVSSHNKHVCAPHPLVLARVRLTTV